MTTTTAKPSFHLTFGKANAEPIHEEWMERCDEGCRCILVEQDRYDDVTELAEAHDGTAQSYANALHVAERTITLWTAEELPANEPAAAYVVRMNVSDGTGMSFLATGWMRLDEARAYLLEVARRA